MTNKQEDFRLILLTQGKFAIVDAEDYKQLSRYKWQAERGQSTFYAKRKSNYKSIKMHRAFLQPPEHLVCDHQNHNGLDNRRSNLRVCTQAQNQRNRRPRRDSTSKYKGVSWSIRARKWRAGIKANGHSTSLGSFDDEMEAALAYDRNAVELFGEFAYLNFPELIEFRKWLTRLLGSGGISHRNCPCVGT